MLKTGNFLSIRHKFQHTVLGHHISHDARQHVQNFPVVSSTLRFLHECTAPMQTKEGTTSSLRSSINIWRKFRFNASSQLHCDIVYRGISVLYQIGRAEPTVDGDPKYSGNRCRSGGSEIFAKFNNVMHIHLFGITANTIQYVCKT